MLCLHKSEERRALSAEARAKAERIENAEFLCYGKTGKFSFVGGVKSQYDLLF